VSWLKLRLASDMIWVFGTSFLAMFIISAIMHKRSRFLHLSNNVAVKLGAFSSVFFLYNPLSLKCFFVFPVERDLKEELQKTGKREKI